MSLFAFQKGDDSTDEWRAEAAEDVFNADYWPDGIVVVRNWHMGFEDETLGKRLSKHKILLRHGMTTGVWIVIVDGAPVMNGIKCANVRLFTVEFQVAGKSAVIEADGTVSGRYAHKLTIDGCVYTDLRDVVTEDREEDIPVNVRVTSSRTELDANGKKFVLYQIVTKTKSGKYTTVERRFSQFDILNNSIRGGLRSHLLSSLPSMPSKLVAPWVDQNSPVFIRERCAQLEVYLNHLLGNSKLIHTTDVMCFLGLHPLTGEPFEPMSQAAVQLINSTFS
jgi:hypothetical protein